MEVVNGKNRPVPCPTTKRTSPPNNKNNTPTFDGAAERLKNLNTTYSAILARLQRNIAGLESFNPQATTESGLVQLVDRLYVRAKSEEDTFRGLEKSLADKVQEKSYLENVQRQQPSEQRSADAQVQDLQAQLTTLNLNVRAAQQAATRLDAREKQARENIICWIAPFLSPERSKRFTMSLRSAMVPENAHSRSPAAAQAVSRPQAARAIALPVGAPPVPPKGTAEEKLATVDQVQKQIAAFSAKYGSRAALERQVDSADQSNTLLRESTDLTKSAIGKASQAASSLNKQIDDATFKRQSLAAGAMRSAAATYVWDRMKDDVKEQMMSFLTENQKAILEAMGDQFSTTKKFLPTDDVMNKVYNAFQAGKFLLPRGAEWKDLDRLYSVERKVLDSTLHFQNYATQVAEASAGSSLNYASLSREISEDTHSMGLAIVSDANRDLPEPLRRIAAGLLAADSKR